MPAHVETAIAEGVEAGFDEWLDTMRRVTKNGKAGLVPVRAELEAIVRKGRVSLKKLNADNANEKQIAYYCNKYGLDIPDEGDDEPLASRKAPAATSGTEDLFEAFQAFLASRGGTEDDDEPKPTPRKSRVTRSTSRKPKAGVQITNGTAHALIAEAMGNEAGYEPRDPDAPATQGKLWKLNDLGLIAEALARDSA